MSGLKSPVDYAEMPTARGYATAVSYQSMMIVMGGTSDGKNTLSITEIFDGTTNQWFKCDLSQVSTAYVFTLSHIVVTCKIMP